MVSLYSAVLAVYDSPWRVLPELADAPFLFQVQRRLKVCGLPLGGYDVFVGSDPERGSLTVQLGDKKNCRLLQYGCGDVSELSSELRAENARALFNCGLNPLDFAEARVVADEKRFPEKYESALRQDLRFLACTRFPVSSAYVLFLKERDRLDPSALEAEVEEALKKGRASKRDILARL